MKSHIYLCRNKNTKIRLKSSSGGIFYELAKAIIDKKGVVFGVSFNKNWGIETIKIDKVSDIEKLMGSKYALANLNGAYKQVKEELERHKPVLFSGTPCQIAGLKQYLNKDYSNLYCVEILCHGVVPQKIWLDYLKTLKRPNTDIKAISFRDKTYGWKSYSVRVDYKDGTTFIQKSKKNDYIKTFLGDKYLLPSCYNCRFKQKEFIGDVTIGDFWGMHGSRYKEFNDNLGTSVLCVNNVKGSKLLSLIDKKIEKKRISRNRASKFNGAWHSKVKVKRETYSSNIFKNKIKNVAILTLSLHKNYGGIMQTYALQTYLEQSGYNVEVPQAPYRSLLQFAKDNVHIKKLKHRHRQFSRYIKQNDYDAYVVGSDQVWRRQYAHSNLLGYFLKFAKKWNVRKIAYAASFGVSKLNYSKPTMNSIRKCLSEFDRVSVREESAVKICQQNFNIAPVVTVDPTMLFDSSFYTNKCKNITHKNGYFAYILDKKKKTKNALLEISKRYKTPMYSYKKGDAKDWLACFRDAKFIITDSYHGCIFSILFNKPFVCFYNTKRGNARFDHLIKAYGLQKRIFNDFDNINYAMLNTKPNLTSKVDLLRKQSVKYLKESLETPLVIKTSSLKN